MDKAPHILVLGILTVGLAATPAAANRELTPELGYVVTSEPKYGSGLVYGVSLMEGDGRLGLGLTFLRLESSSSWEKSLKTGEEFTVYRYREELSDSYVGILATWMHGKQPKRRLVVGAGPQIHFLSATKQYVLEKYALNVRESRLGIGALVRYQRQIEMFGKTSLVVTASYSWMESGVELMGTYAPPADGLTSAALTLGLAFPF